MTCLPVGSHTLLSVQSCFAAKWNASGKEIMCLTFIGHSPNNSRMAYYDNDLLLMKFRSIWNGNLKCAGINKQFHGNGLLTHSICKSTYFLGYYNLILELNNFLYVWAK